MSVLRGQKEKMKKKSVMRELENLRDIVGEFGWVGRERLLCDGKKTIKESEIGSHTRILSRGKRQGG